MTVAAVASEANTGKVGKPRVYHEAIIDEILLNPAVLVKDLAKQFGVSPAWMTILTTSDAFQRRLHERKDELVDPLLKATLEDRLRGVFAKSLEVLLESLENKPDPKLALSVAEMGSRALGYGAKPPAPAVAQQFNFVVQAPAKSENSLEWSKQYRPAQLLSPSEDAIMSASVPNTQNARS